LQNVVLADAQLLKDDVNRKLSVDTELEDALVFDNLFQLRRGQGATSCLEEIVDVDGSVFFQQLTHNLCKKNQNLSL
jgi:hypothetical protein